MNFAAPLMIVFLIAIEYVVIRNAVRTAVKQAIRASIPVVKLALTDTVEGTE